MDATQLLIFDDGAGQWGPLTDLRPVFELRTGALTTRQRIEAAVGMKAGSWVVPADLTALMADKPPVVTVYGPVEPGNWLFVNGRWPGVAHSQRVRELPLGTALVGPEGHLVAAHLPHVQAQAMVLSRRWQAPADTVVQQLPGRVLLDRPWHIMDELDQTLRADLDASVLPDCDCACHDAGRFGDHRVRVAPDAWLQPKVVFNATQGPIVVDTNALIGAGSVLEGPCYIGPGSQVSCHAHIRPHTVIGPKCKVAGEISHSIIHGYSNKGHHGYLGHSLVGQWVNLGAATNVSNLKNTYGQIRMQLDGDSKPQDTGRQYQGPVIGDYVRTGIGTRLPTGSCISTGAMIALSGYTPKFIERFAFLTDAAAQRYDTDKFLATARHMMGRRDCSMSDALEARLRGLANNGAVSRAA